MRNLSMNPRSGRLQKSIVAGVVAFLALTIALIFWPNAITVLTGISHQPHLSAPDDLSAATKDDPTSFLSERDQIEIKVAEATTLREFLDRNRLNKQSQVKQIAAQLGSNVPTTPIAAGTIFRIRLTPGAEDVPGVVPRKR
ncbi:MAG TPA: hypothetical protein VGQ76_02105 [Thermoanaerobaculia bacterium]|jgi:hypothetical protein|nr:hypothetical protein [Thermoanaerobaculia bacterium]